MKSFTVEGTKGEGVGGGGRRPSVSPSPHAGGQTTAVAQWAPNPGPVNPLEVAVERGAAYLELHRPGWAKRVIVDFLDVDHGRLCPVAWAFEAPFSDTAPGRLWTLEELWDHGFAAHDEEERRALNVLWAWLVVNRR